MKNTKRGLSIFLALTLLITSIGIGLGTGALKSDVPEAEAVSSTTVPSYQIHFYVPETIYLTPASGNASTFRFYVDSSNSTSPVLNNNKAKTTGNVYFYCANATAVSLVCTGATVDISMNSGTTTIGAVVTGGTLNTPIAQKATSTLTWTATYTVDGQTMTAKAYTVCYAPPIEAIGVAQRLYNDDGTGGGYKADLQGWFYVSGVQGYGTGGIRTFNQTSGKVVCPMLGTVTAPPGNTAYNDYITGSSGGVYYGDWSGGDDTYALNKVSPTGILTVDTSRYNNINQIPNFTCGMAITHTNNMDDLWYYMSDYDDVTNYTGDYQGSDSKGVFNNNTGNIFFGDVNTKRTVTQSIIYGGQTGGNVYSNAISGNGTYNMKFKGAASANNDGETNTFACVVPVTVTMVKKDALRTNVRYYTNMGLQAADYTGDAADFIAFQNELSASAVRLGTVTGSDTSDTLAAKYAALTKNTYVATVNHKLPVTTGGTGNVNGTPIADDADGTADGYITITETKNFSSGDTVDFAPNNYAEYVIASANGYTPNTSAQTVLNRRSAITQNYIYIKTECTVTFNANGGTVNPTTSDVALGAVYGSGTGGWPTPIKSGYTFEGWFTGVGGTGTKITMFTTLTTAVDQTLYAKWSPHTYTIAYDPGVSSGIGGSPMDVSEATYDVPITLRVNTFTRTGYNFIGWATSNGGQLQYIDGDAVSNLTAVNEGSVTLYATWTGNVYTVHYNGNGETGGSTTNSNHVYGTPKNLTANGFTKTGYTFAGWATSAGGPKVYDNAHTVTNLMTLPGAFDLYAVWTANTYTIAYNPNGGEGTTMTPSAHTYDGWEPLTANGYTRTGYTFLGWSKDQEATTPTYTDGAYVTNVPPATGNITFFAVWSINRYTVTFNANGGTGEVPLTVNQDYATPVALPATAGNILWPVTIGTTAVKFSRGWNTTMNADEKLSSYAVPASNSTLYTVWGADYTDVLNASNLANADYLPATNDTRYLPGGDLYQLGGFTHTGIYPRSDFTWASIANLNNAVQAIDFTRKQSEQDTLVDGYETAIMAAYGNIVLAPADYSTLNGLIYDATDGLNRALYTTDSLVAVDDERANGEAMVANAFKKPLQYRVDQRCVALENALNSLVFKEADYSVVRDIWNTGPDFTKYTDDSVYDVVYFYEQEINWDLLIDNQYIVDDYARTLRDLMDALVLKAADYTGVIAALVAIPDGDGNEYFDKQALEEIYNTSSVANLEDKVNAVDWDKDITEQLAVDGYAQAIVAATSALIPRAANYTFLGVALNKPLLLPVSYYTEASYQFYQSKMTNGWNRYNNQNLTILQQGIIDQATQAIYDAYDLLTPKTVNYTVKYQTTDETPLQLAIDAVKTGPAGSQVTETALGITGYTPVETPIQKILTGTDFETVIIFTYVINEYTVTFDANGGTDVDAITQNYNTTVAQPDDPTRTGYVFAGWYLDEALTTAVTWPYTLGGSNVTFYANWTANTYTIIYDGSGATSGSTASSLQTYDAASNLTSNGFTKIGNSFVGWATTPGGTAAYSDGQSVTNLTPTLNDVITFYAVWAINEYTISFNSDGGSPLADITQDYDTSVTAPADPTKEGYTFNGWLPAVPATMPAEDTECVAQWTINEYTVSFDSDGGSSVDSITQDYATEITAPADPTKTGYTFNGWLPAVPATMPAEDTECVAQWTINEYTVSFDSDGGSVVADITQDYATEITAPADPTKTGYTFNGWLPAVPATMPAEDTECVAQWTINEYTVSFDSDGGSVVADITQDYATEITAPADPTKTGYTFNGWLPAVPATMPAEDTECVAQWTINEYTVSFDSDGGSAVDSITQDYATEITAPADPTKTGYTFIGWSPAVPATMPAEDTECVAQWTLNSYTITFDADGGTGGEAQTVEHGTTPVAPEVSREGHTFIDWAPEVAAATADATYTAQWAINSYDLTFDANGGTGGTGTTSTEYGTALTAPTVTREGYTFTGWDPELAATMPAADTTYTAQWSIDAFTISFDSNGGSAVADITQDYGTAVTQPADPTKEGYTFIGWSPAVPPVMPAEDIECVAQWTLNTYTITFDADGGTGGEAQTVEHGTTPVAPEVSREGHTFIDWTPAIAAATADATYTAQWNINSYDLTYDANGGTGGTGPIATEYNSALSAPTVTREGYTFDSWSPEVAETMPAADTVYTALWTINSYDLTYDANGGTGGTGPIATEYNSALSAPTVTREGYTFDSWSPEVAETMPAADTVYTALWTINSYDLTYDANGGTGGTGPIATEYNSALSAPTVTREGYTFDSWSPEVAETMPAADTVYTAQWAIKEYTISFDSTGGSPVADITQDYNTSVTAPTDPTRTGYTFDSWVPAVPANMPAENIECVAQWTAINYTITWDANGGEGGTTTSEAYGSTPAGPTVTLAGYAFTGWEPEVVPVTGATTYTAQWELIPIALKEAPGSTTVIDTERYYIYGLVEGITQSEFEDDFVDVLGNGRLEITTMDGDFGTGTKIELIDIATDEVVETYIIIIFGDVNGDGYVGGVDADIIINVDNYDTEWDPITQDYLYFAGDLDWNGYTEAVDADIIINVENYASYIDQRTGITYEY